MRTKQRSVYKCDCERRIIEDENTIESFYYNFDEVENERYFLSENNSNNKRRTGFSSSPKSRPNYKNETNLSSHCDSNHSCQTKRFCYTSINREPLSKKIQLDYGCLDSDSQTRFMCQLNNHEFDINGVYDQGSSFHMSCCDPKSSEENGGGNYCNSGLRPFLKRLSEEERKLLDNNDRDNYGPNQSSDFDFNSNDNDFNGKSVYEIYESIHKHIENSENKSSLVDSSLPSSNSNNIPNSNLASYSLIISLAAITIVTISAIFTSVRCVINRRKNKNLMKNGQFSSSYNLNDYASKSQSVLTHGNHGNSCTSNYANTNNTQTTPFISHNNTTHTNLDGSTIARTLDSRSDFSSRVHSQGVSSYGHPMGHSTLKGSGLVQRTASYYNPVTISKQISLQDLIGQGRYGKVYKGVYSHQQVAVKIFLTRDESSWKAETDLYNTMNLRHDNLLRFIASDMTTRHNECELWIVTEFHNNGSLYDLLSEHAPFNNLDHLYRILASSAAGLCYLHTKISVNQVTSPLSDKKNQGKTAIAHRDIKTRNILVKNDLTCCISDLGLSISEVNLSKVTNDSNFNIQSGTIRHMPPEILKKSINISDFQSFISADVYCFSLVMWEVLNSLRNPHQQPFHNFVDHNPDFNEMIKVVIDQKCRPSFINCQPYSNDEVDIFVSSSQNKTFNTKIKVFNNGINAIMNLCYRMWIENSKMRIKMVEVKSCLNEFYYY